MFFMAFFSRFFHGNIPWRPMTSRSGQGGEVYGALQGGQGPMAAMARCPAWTEHVQR